MLLFVVVGCGVVVGCVVVGSCVILMLFFFVCCLLLFVVKCWSLVIGEVNRCRKLIVFDDTIVVVERMKNSTRLPAKTRLTVYRRFAVCSLRL